MHLNYVAWGIPLFLSLMALEYLVAKKTGKNYFGFDSTVSNINVGIFERLLDVFTVGLFYFIYEYLHSHFAIWDIQPHILWWVTLLMVTDFIWYWYHRLAHEVNVLWAVHVVHHQSEDFNYTVSARITVFQAFARMCFWAILPVMGFPPAMIVTIQLIHGIYPFFIHTRTIPKLGFLEYILVTPSHHRVHHASNEQYLDRNYGDVFIFWDKLFGTFTEEGEEPAYGLTKPLESQSFLWQHFHYLIEIGYTIRHTKGFWNRVRVVFGPPALMDERVRPLVEARFLQVKQEGSANPRLKRYVVGQVVALLTGLFFFLLFINYIPIVLQVCVSIVILLSLINCGAILEQRRWVFYLEYSRVLVVLIAINLYFPYEGLLWFFILLHVPIFLLRHTLERSYLRLLYGNVT